MKKGVYFLQALLIYPFYAAVRLLPLAVASRLGARIGQWLGGFRKETQISLQNLALALPQLSDEQRQDITNQVWENLGRTTMEFLLIDKLSAEFDKRVEVIGVDHARSVLAEGRSIVMLSGHFANWNVLAMALSHRVGTTAIIYRPTNNPFVMPILRARYNDLAAEIVAKGEPASHLIKFLNESTMVAMLADQHMSDGVEVSFLGQKVLAPTGPALIGQRAGSALIPGFCERITKGDDAAYFRVTIYPELKVAKEGGRPRDRIMDLTQSYYRFLEDRISERPAEWLWLHDRFSKNKSGPDLDNDATTG